MTTSTAKSQSLDNYRQAGEYLTPLSEQEVDNPDWLEAVGNFNADLRDKLDGIGLDDEARERTMAGFNAAKEALRHVQQERELAYEALYLATAMAGYDAIAHHAETLDDPQVNLANEVYDQIADWFMQVAYSKHKNFRWHLGV